MHPLLDAIASPARANIAQLHHARSERSVCSAAVARGVRNAVRENAQLVVSR